MPLTWEDLYQNRRVLVVGGSGFIGRNLLLALEHLGAAVTATGRAPDKCLGKCSSLRSSLSHVRWLDPVDFSTFASAQRAVDGQDVVIDCIGRLGAADSNQQPLVSLQGELAPQLHLALACASAKPAPLLLFLSSRLVYGAPRYLPVDESHPLQPASFYALHKLTTEGHCRILGQTSGLRFCVLRLSNPYGPHQPAHSKSYGVINNFLRLAAENKPIEVFGDGAQVRDYIHVEDAVEAILRCAVSAAATGQTMNLGSGFGISLSEAAHAIRRAASSPPVRHRPWPTQTLALETGDYVSDLSLLRSTIGTFEPRSFAQDLEACIDSYRTDAIAPRLARGPATAALLAS